MAAGVIFGECPVCGELVWEDNWDMVRDVFVHNECKKKYIKQTSGLNDEQYERLVEKMTQRKRIQEEVKFLKNRIEKLEQELSLLKGK